MNTGNSRKKIIPPTHSRVKAGFVVYSPESEERELIILDEGELVALDKSGGNREIKFHMHPGDIVGVASLFEREPFRYTIEATEDSVITVLSEECLESELKSVPVWLLAILRKLSSRTRQEKHAARTTPVENTLKSLAQYCAQLESGQKYPLEQFTREFNWLTHIPAAVIKNDIKTLARRNFVNIVKDGESLSLQVNNATLTQIFSDYLHAQDEGILWAPLRLNLAQKRILVHLTTLDASIQMEAPEWINFLSSNGLPLDVSQWITLENIGCFAPDGENKFHVDQAKVEYYLTAIRYDSNLRGAV